MGRFRLISALVCVAGAAQPVAAEPLPESAAGRRAIRGAPLPLAVESEELREIRRFEESSFPRQPLYVPDAPGEVSAEEGPAPPGPAARLSAESPPTSLTSPGQSGPAPVAAEPPPPAWLSELRRPDIPTRWDPRVVRYLEFYKSDRRGRATMAAWLRKQGRFRAGIEDALRRHRLPQALLYIAMIESSYDVRDRSSAGAAGLWQFMPDGGRIYGLRIDHWVDERRNPERSTEAVMRYFADLETRFGSWHLAMAAFNAGYGAVLRAIAKYNTNDYWELCRHEDGLPWETTLYVPKWIAAAIVGENREAFGFGDLVPEPAYEYDRVLVPASTGLAAIARAAGVPSETIAILNPELLRGRTPPGTPWEARVPRGAGPRFATAWPQQRERVVEHVLRFGERLDDVARAVGASVAELKRLNGIDDRAEVQAGLTIVVPAGRGPLPPPAAAEEITLVAVPDDAVAVPGHDRVFYRALPTDTLPDLAHLFHLSPTDLAKWNHLDPAARLTSKMVLQLFVPRDLDTSRISLLDPARVRVVTIGSDEFLDLVEARRGRRRLAIAARPGDTLRSIGARYHLTEGDMERINRLGRSSKLAPGQPLVVYVNLSPREQREAAKRPLTGTPIAPDDADEEALDDSIPRRAEAASTAAPPGEGDAPPAPPAAPAQAGPAAEPLPASVTPLESAPATRPHARRDES